MTKRRGRIPGPRSPEVRRAVVAAGGSMTDLARLLDISPQAISQWRRIPTDRIVDVERVTRIDRARLRPDLYRRGRA